MVYKIRPTPYENHTLSYWTLGMILLSGARLYSAVTLFTAFIASTYGFGIYLFPAIAPAMIQDIQFTYSEMGLTTGITQAGFLIFALVSGLLTSYLGSFRIIMASIFLCALSLLGLIWADSFKIISILLIVMGGCTASVWVPMVEVCQKYISTNHQGKVLGLVSSGTSYGVFINSLLIAFLLDEFGWRSLWLATFMIVACICICAVFVFRSMENDNPHFDRQLATESDSATGIIKKLLSLPRETTVLIMLMMFLNDWVIVHAVPNLPIFVSG